MKVMIIPSWYPKDANDVHASFFREQAQAVQSVGCEVSVLSATLAPLRQPIAAMRGHGRIQYNDEDGVQVWRWTGTNIWPGAEQLRAKMVSRGVSKLYAQHVVQFGVPDIIHVQAALPAGYAASILAGQIGRPYVLTEHASAYFRGRISPQGRTMARHVAEGARRQFAVSRPFAERLPEWLDMTPDSWDVMPNLVEDMFLTAPLTDRSGPFQFLHVSNLSDIKNVDVVIAAFADQFAGRDDVVLNIGGDGPNQDSLKAAADRLGVAGQVRFLGRLSRAEVCDAMRQADCFVLASSFETFGVVVVEALATGCPVIATCCGGPEDIMQDSDGILIQTDDPAALAAAMATMIDRQGRYERGALRASCAARFSAAAIGQRWMSVYQDVLGKA